MKRLVRDDIIRLDSYVEAEFKYRKELEIIKGVGGYFFLDQAKKYWDHKGGEYFIKKMEDAKLLIKDTFGKYVYYRLSSTAIKYLTYRDSDKDYSDIEKSKLSGSYLSAHPSEKVLFTSSMLFTVSSLLTNVATRPKHIETLEKFLFVNRSAKKLETKKRLDLLEVEISRANLVNQSTTKAINQVCKELRANRENRVTLSENIKVMEDGATLLKSNKHEIDKKRLEIALESKFTDALFEIKNILPSIEVYPLENERQGLVHKLHELKKEEEYSIVEGQKIISKFMKYRDSAKVMLTLCKDTNEDEDYEGEFYKPISQTFLKVYVFSVRHPSSYLGIIRNALKLLNESPLIKRIDCVDVSFISVFECNESVLEEDLKELQEESKFRFRYSSNCAALYSMQNYLQVPNSDISYIKRKDVDTFEELRKKLDK